MERNLGLSLWLRQRCEKEGLSLRQAAAKTGLSHNTIYQILNNGSASPDSIMKLAQAFGGNGQLKFMLEDKLLVLAGCRSYRPGEKFSEPLARVLDKLSEFSESQLKIMSRFADFLSEMKED